MPCNHERSALPFVAFALLAALLLTGGCTTFGHAWANAARQSPPTDGILGPWEGTWLSDANGHQGSLRCIVTRKRDGSYEARFHATYRKVLRFGYTVPLQVTENTNVLSFSGEANLGWWAGGVYHYEGYARQTNFFSTYRCKYDRGTFQMLRPVNAGATAKKPGVN